MKKESIAILFFAALFTVVVANALIFDNWHIASQGTLKTINVTVFWDANLTIPAYNLDWGFVETGASHNQTLYVRNDSNVNMTINFYTGMWNPLGVDLYISVVWDRDGVVLLPHNSTEATLTMYVEPMIEQQGYTDFSFEVLIEGSG